MESVPAVADPPGEGPPIEDGEADARFWNDPDGGRWRLYTHWLRVPKKAGLLAIIVRRGLECQLVEWHPTYNMRIVAKTRLHALAPAFIGSPDAGHGGTLAFGVLVPSKSHGRRKSWCGLSA